MIECLNLFTCHFCLVFGCLLLNIIYFNKISADALEFILLLLKTVLYLIGQSLTELVIKETGIIIVTADNSYIMHSLQVCIESLTAMSVS